MREFLFDFRAVKLEVFMMAGMTRMDEICHDVYHHRFHSSQDGNSGIHTNPDYGMNSKGMMRKIPYVSRGEIPFML